MNIISDFFQNIIFTREMLLVVLVIALIIMVLRELRCYYWKINERIELQNKEIELLQQILDRNNRILMKLEYNARKDTDPYNTDKL